MHYHYAITPNQVSNYVYSYFSLLLKKVKIVFLEDWYMYEIINKIQINSYYLTRTNESRPVA